MTFCNFNIISPWKRVSFFNLDNLESPSPKMAFCQIWLKLACGSGEKDFYKLRERILLFCNYLLLVSGVFLHLNKLEFPSYKDALCQVWLKMAQCFWNKIFFLIQWIFEILFWSPLEKRHGPLLNYFHTKNLITSGFCISWYILHLF